MSDEQLVQAPLQLGQITFEPGAVNYLPQPERLEFPGARAQTMQKSITLALIILLDTLPETMWRVRQEYDEGYVRDAEDVLRAYEQRLGKTIQYLRSTVLAGIADDEWKGYRATLGALPQLGD